MQQGSIRIKRQPKAQITRQAIWWGKADTTESDDEKNYKKNLQAIYTTAETAADENNVSEAKQIKSDWLTNSTSDNSIATGLIQRNINRYGETPIEITFDVDQAYVKAVTGGNMWLGSIFNATTNKLTDGRLSPLTKTYQCLSVSEVKTSKYRITGQSYIAAAPPTADFYISEDTLDFTLATDPVFSTILGDVREYVVVVGSNVNMCSSTVAAGFQQGAFPVGATLKIINLGFIMGKGGAGGDGGSATAGTPITYGTAAAGGDGGDALELTTDCTIDNAYGFIGGGGGGSGGYTGASATSGDGGDGGQGCNGGAAGLAGAAIGDGILEGQGGQAGTKEYAGTTGGEWGEAGDNNDATGGAAGSAIITNGNTVTITSGNNSAQIKGAVV